MRGLVLILRIAFVVSLGMYTSMAQATDYPSSTTSALTVDLDFNVKKISNIGDVIISAHVQAANTVRVVLRNVSGSTLDIASGTLRVNVWKY